jgi:hypothetical protein
MLTVCREIVVASATNLKSRVNHTVGTMSAMLHDYYHGKCV